MVEPEKQAPRARTIWERRVRDPIVAQLTQGITPEKIALTLAVGSACALFPIIGTTTLLCLVVGIVLRLNQPIIQAVNILCAPIHIPLVFSLMVWGQKVFGGTPLKLNPHYVSEALRSDPATFFRRFGDAAMHASILWLAAVPVWIAAVYYVSRPVLRGIARVRAENAAKVIAQKPPDHPVP